MVTVSTVTQNKKAINWRYGRDYDYFNMRYTWRRTPYANKLVVGAVDDALGKRFNILEMITTPPTSEGEKPTKEFQEIEKNDEAWEIIGSMWKDIKKTMYYDRAYGNGLGSFFQDKQLNPFWRAYDVNDYFVRYNDFGMAEQYDVINRVGGTNASAQHQTLLDKDLTLAYEIITRETEIKGEGISIMEAPWDTLFSLASLDEQGTYYAIRYGAGIRYMKIPEKKFNDQAFMSRIMAMLKGSIGANGVYALPYSTVAGVKEEFEIASEHAVQINFLQLRDLMLGSLAAQTGIPIEIFLGSRLGLRSSEKNEDAYFDYLQGIQEDYRDFLKWIVITLNALFKWFSLDAIIDIGYIPRETLDEEEKVMLVGTKVDVASSAGYTVPKDWLAKELGIPLEDKEIDPLGISGAGDGDDTGEEETEEDESDDDNEDDDTDEQE